MLRKAAFASNVVASTPTVLPRNSPPSASCCNIQVKTASCVSTLKSRRVREIVEWSGGAAGTARCRNDRRLIESAARHAIARSESNPSKYPTNRQPEIAVRRQTRSPHPRIERCAQLVNASVNSTRLASGPVVTSNPSRRSADDVSWAAFSGFGSRPMWALGAIPTTVGIARTTNTRTAATSDLTAFIPIIALTSTLHLACGRIAYWQKQESVCFVNSPKIFRVPIDSQEAVHDEHPVRSRCVRSRRA